MTTYFLTLMVSLSIKQQQNAVPAQRHLVGLELLRGGILVPEVSLHVAPDLPRDAEDVSVAEAGDDEAHGPGGKVVVQPGGLLSGDAALLHLGRVCVLGLEATALPPLRVPL